MNSRAHRVATVLALAALAMLAAGCGGKTKENGTAEGENAEPEGPKAAHVKIGVLLPLSGEHSARGDAVLAGLRFAFERKGKPLGLGGASIVVEDYGDHPADLLGYASNLIDVKGVSLIIGPFSAEGVKMIETLAKRKKVAVLTPTTEPMTLLPVGSTVWRLTFSDADEGRAMAAFAEKKGYRATAVFDDVDLSASLSRAAAFQKQFRATYGEDAAWAIAHDPDVNDLRRKIGMVVTNRTYAQRDVFYLAGTRERSVAILNTMKDPDAGLDVKGVAVLGSTSWETSLSFPVTAAGPPVFAPTRFYADRVGTGTAEFVRAFREKHGRDPGLYDALGYDAGLVIVRVLGDAGSDGDAILKGLATLGELDGVTGRLTSAAHTLTGSMTVLKLDGRTFKFETEVELR